MDLSSITSGVNNLVVTQNLTNENIEESKKVAYDSGLTLTDSNFILQNSYQNISVETENIKESNETIAMEQIKAFPLDSISNKIDSILDTYSSSGASIYDPEYKFLSHQELSDMIESTYDELTSLSFNDTKIEIPKKVTEELKNIDTKSKETIENFAQTLKKYQEEVTQNIKKEIGSINENLMKISEIQGKKADEVHSKTINNRIEDINFEKKEALNSNQISTAHEPKILIQQLSNLLL